MRTKYDTSFVETKVILEYELDSHQQKDGWYILDTFVVHEDYITQVQEQTEALNYRQVNKVCPKQYIKFLVGKTDVERVLYGQS